MGETAKAKPNRLINGWFEKYAPERFPGIDIGCGDDPLNVVFRRWDIALSDDALLCDGDATWMDGVPDKAFFTVYASHILETLVDPVAALASWYRILSPGGHLIVVVPHRDMYEKKKELPSNWNPTHKTFWLPEDDEPPFTLGLKSTIMRAIPGARIVSLEVLDEGFFDPGPMEHSHGQYSIEAIVQK